MEAPKADSLESLPLHANAPSSSMSLNRRAVMTLALCISTIIGVSILWAFTPSGNNEVKKTSSTYPAAPGEVIRNLPSDYTKIKQSPIKLGPPLKGELGPVQIAHEQAKQLSAEEKWQEELKLQRIKLAVAARIADVGFQGIRLESKNQQPNTERRKQSFEDSLSALTTTGLPLSSPLNSRDEDNRQDEKLSFASTRHDESSYLHSSLQKPISRYQLMAGTIVPGVLLTGINSDLPGQILGQVSQNIFNSVNGRYLLLPQGTKVLGEYDSRVSYGQERVLIVWTRLIFPSGKSLNLEGMPGVDLSGYSGLTDKVNNHYLKLASGVILGSLLGAGAQMARGSNQTIDPSFGQLALEGSAQNINQVGQQITRKNLNIQPTLEISPGHRFNIFVTKDLVLEPYKQ